MKSLGERISEQITELADVELLKLKIEFSIFNNKVNESYKEKIAIIEKNFESQATFYGKKEEEYIGAKDEIIAKYDAEFQKIYDARKEQFYNLVNEISEMQANQKIAFINMGKVIKEKEACESSREYKEYLRKKIEFETEINNTLVSTEYNRYTKLLEDLHNPVDDYYKKVNALAEKFDNYQAIIAECEKKLSECADSTEQDFIQIMKYRNETVATVKKNNPISKIISKILNTFAGKAKYEKEVVAKMNSELEEIEKTNSAAIQVIADQTLTVVSKIEELREETNKMFKVAMG